MESEEFLLGLKEVSMALTDLLVEAEENNYMHHDRKVFKLLSKAFLAVELAYAIKARGEAKLDAEIAEAEGGDEAALHYGPVECPF